MSYTYGPCNNGPCYQGYCGWCIDPDVTLPDQMTLTISIGQTTNSSVQIYFACGLPQKPYCPSCPGSFTPIPGVSEFPGWASVTAPIQPQTWVIPLQRVAPPVTAPGSPQENTFFAAWVNSKADYYGGHFPVFNNPPPFFDSQGYQRVPNPAAGATAPFCYSGCYQDSQGFFHCGPPGPLTIGNNLGLAVLLGLCPTNSLLNLPTCGLWLMFLDLDTPHIQSCNLPSAGFRIGGYFSAGLLPANMQSSAANPFTAAWGSAGPCAFSFTGFVQNCGTGGCCNSPSAVSMVNTGCGSCVGFQGKNFLDGGPVWFTDAVGYNFGIIDSALIAGGSGSSRLELDYPCIGVCPGVYFQNTYTLTISGDFTYINGSYTIAFIGCAFPFAPVPNPQPTPIPRLAWSWGGGCAECQFNFPDPYASLDFNAFYSFGFTFVLDGESIGFTQAPFLITPWGVSKPSYFHCSPLVASGAIHFSGPLYSAGGIPGQLAPAPCNGISSGNLYWTVS